MSNAGRAQAISQSEFYVSRAGESLGPWTIAQIVERLGSLELAVTDFVFDDSRGDWVPMIECAPLVEALRAAKPKAPPKPSLAIVTSDRTGTASQNVAEWFVLRGAQRVGPLSRRAVIRALQEKTISSEDRLWKEGMPDWRTVASCEEFAAERVLELMRADDSREIFLQRRYPRIEFVGEALVHDDRHVWMARTIQGGEGGSGLIIANSRLRPGQVVHLHVVSRDGLPAFNTLCEIVSKRPVSAEREPVRHRSANAPHVYGTKFLSIEPSVEARVKEYFRTRAGR